MNKNMRVALTIGIAVTLAIASIAMYSQYVQSARPTTLVAPGEENSLEEIEPNIKHPNLKNASEKDLVKTVIIALVTDDFELYCAAKGVHPDSVKITDSYREEYKTNRGYLSGLDLDSCLKSVVYHKDTFELPEVHYPTDPQANAHFFTIEKDGEWYFRCFSFF